LFGEGLEMFGDGLEKVGLKKDTDEDKSDKSSSHGKESKCDHSDLDLGDGPADWIFTPSSLRDLFHHSNKKFGKELVEETDWLKK
tara:strand:- start:181 stop:435 length:255 start_codon:yes stop_codon:yes gene_type:complete